MNDLKEKYPDIFAGYIMTLEATQKRFAAFYEQAVLGGYCKSLPIGLVGEQIRTMLPVIIRGDYLSRRKTTLPEVIADYYQLLLYQLLSKEYMDTAERDHICSFVDDVVKILKNQFLLD